MSRRPAILPTWITSPDADPLQNVEPTANARNFGFAPGDRPPAPWINNLFHTMGQGFEYLYGTLLANWQRVSYGFATLDTAKSIEFAVDDVTAPPASARPFIRLVVVGTEDSGTDAKLRVSADGDTWFERSPTQSATPITNAGPLVFTGTHWLLAENGVTGAIWRTTDATDTGGSAVYDDGNDWSATTLPASTGGFKAIVARSTTEAIAAAFNKPIYSTDDGATWSNASLSGAATGSFTDCCFTSGGIALAITDDGEIYRAGAGIAGTWTKLGTDLPDEEWRLEPGANGFVLAYPYIVGSPDDWYVSEDDGATWTLRAAPATGFDSIRRIRYLDGNWLAVAFSLSSSNSLWQATEPTEDGWEIVPLDAITDGASPANPVGDGDARDVHRCQGRNVLAAALRAFRTPRAQGLDPGTFVPTALAAALRDAAYLRGRVVSDATPVDRDVLEWDATNDEWAPMGPGAYTRIVKQSIAGGNYNVAAKVSTVFVTSSVGGASVTLPVPEAGRRVTIKDSAYGASTGNITVTPNAAEDVEGGASYIIAVDGESVTVESDGADWWIVSQFVP